MTQSLEADVTYLYKIGGARQTIQPAGFAVRTATRRPARGRDRDLLFVAVVLHPRSPASSARPAPLETSAVESEAVELIDVAAGAYFGVPGSVTSALRETGSAVNLALLQWNLRVARQAINAQGSLALAVLRNTELYVAQAGTASAVVIRPDGHERFPSEFRGNRPLGISQTADVSFSLTSMAAGDYLVLGNEAWSDPALSGFNDLTLELAADRLIERSGPEASGLVARFVPSGTVQGQAESGAASVMDRLRSRLPVAAATSARRQPRRAPAPEPPSAPPPPAPARPAPEPPSAEAEADGDLPFEPPTAPAVEARQAQPVEAVLPPLAEEDLDIDEEEEAPAPLLETYARRPAPAAPVAAPQPRRRPPRISDDDETPLQPLARSTPARSARPSPLAGLQASIEKSLNSAGQRLQSALGSLFRGMLPEGMLSDRVRPPISLLATIAIGLPIVVGLLVTSVYIQRGQAQQYNGFLQQAQVEVSLARTAPDALSAKPHWNAALDWLGRAEAVRPATAEVTVLRAEAQSFLDSTEQITRLNFQPLVAGGFGPGVNLTNVVVSGSEVYALDPGLGHVFRAVRTGAGAYALDEAFNKCASGPVGQHTVGPIVDMAWLTGPNPAGSDSLIVMDGAGTLAFCPPDGSPPLATQLIPPDTGWTGPRSLGLYSDGLYVLDPPGNQIWVFTRPGGQFSEGPSRYFTATSFDLSQAVDFAIANGEVFVLFGDGRVMTCSRSADGLQAECQEAPQFTDGRQGHTNGPHLDDLQRPFALLYDPPPEPSLYLADAGPSAVYQVSLKLVLQGQYRPAGDLGAPLSALAIGGHKEIYAAAGNNVYVGERP